MEKNRKLKKQKQKQKIKQEVLFNGKRKRTPRAIADQPQY